MTRLQQMLLQFFSIALPVPEFMSYIRQHKLDLKILDTEIGIFGVVLCRRFQWQDGSAGFEFSAHGSPYVVIEALYYRTIDGLRETYAADLVAWPVDDPLSIATALGPKDGAELLGPRAAIQRGGQPLPIFKTPLAWMKADCVGSVLLKPGSEYWLHKAKGPFVAEDIQHAAEIWALLGADAHKHRILVARPQIKRAA